MNLGRIKDLLGKLAQNTHACLTKKVCGFCRYYTPSRYIGTHLSEGWCSKWRCKKKSYNTCSKFKDVG